jgi:benzylsuccinate CoA-transferase BbsF subunit
LCEPLAIPFKDNIVGIDRSAYYTAFNTNKYGMSLNLNNPKSQEVAHRLVKWADIINESMAPGKMAKWGLDYESCKKIKPDTIYLSTTQAGQKGPWSHFGGYGNQGAAISGFYDIIGWPDRSPTPPNIPITDHIAPWFMIVATIAALDYRRRTGKGIYIEQSQWESSLHFLGPWLLDYKVNGRILTRMGNRDPYAAPHGAFPCKGNDRWIAIAVRNDEEWHAFCEVVGRPNWTNEDRFSSLIARKENEDELEKLIKQWTQKFTDIEIMEMMQKAGVPAGAVGGGSTDNTFDIFKDPQLKHREHFRTLEHPVIGRHIYNAPSYLLSKTPNDIHKAGPCLGEDNEYIYKDLLGYSDEDIENFLVEGVITTESDLPGMAAMA